MATSTKQVVATVPVYDYVLAPGDPSATNPPGLRGRRVKVTLAYDKAVTTAPNPTVWTTGTIYATLLDDNGFWQVYAVPTNRLSPTGCYYLVEIDGLQSYKINPTDVAVPAIGWASSAILIDTPSSLAPAGQTVGALTVTGAFVANSGAAITGNSTITGTLTVTGALSANGGITLGGTITRAGTSAKVLLSAVVTNLDVAFNGAAGTAEQEVTGLRVSLPIIAAVCLVKIQLTAYIGTGAGNTTFRIRAGTSTTYLSNAIYFDGGYLANAVDPSFNMTMWVSLNLTTQTYVVISMQNDVSGATVSVSASGNRSSVITEVYQ